MSNLTGRDQVMSTDFGMVAVPVQITFGASGAVSAYEARTGAPVVPTKATTGRYTFTFTDKYPALLGVAAGAHDYQGTATDGQWQIYTGYSSTAGTVSLSHTVAGSETNPASGNVVDLIFFMRARDI